MERIGSVKELWRYPVKSMGGEQIAATVVGPQGLPGDRGWAVRDEVKGEIRGAKKLPGLLRCTARYPIEPDATHVPPAEITFPDGARLRSNDPEAAVRLTSLVGRRVTLWPRQPADHTDFYRRAEPDNPDIMAELRQVFGRTEDEPIPDITAFPAELMEFTSPLGTFFDAFPIHLLSTAALAALGPAEVFDRRRFRPNFFVQSTPDLQGLVEHGLAGRRLRIGGLVLHGEMPTARCVMTTLEQPGLAKNPGVLRTIVRDAAQCLGLYATVVTPGRVAVGDAVEVE
ncbi:MAG: MOSC N-terminal beta barrel domain-containing protein [bacterium]|nr:MOSC N-terminal beta barrel domain-containing protein [bacterium]